MPRIISPNALLVVTWRSFSACNIRQAIEQRTELGNEINVGRLDCETRDEDERSADRYVAVPLPCAAASALEADQGNEYPDQIVDPNPSTKTKFAAPVGSSWTSPPESRSAQSASQRIYRLSGASRFPG